MYTSYAYSSAHAYIYTRVCIYNVPHLVTCTCQNQYLASLGYDNAAACRWAIHTHFIPYAYVHVNGTICRISWNFRIGLATSVNNATLKLFSISRYACEHSVAVTRHYWIFLNC